MTSGTMEDGNGCCSEMLATAYQTTLCIYTTVKTSISFFTTTGINYFPDCKIRHSHSIPIKLNVFREVTPCSLLSHKHQCVPVDYMDPFPVTEHKLMNTLYQF